MTEPDVFRALHGLYWLVAELAEHQPLVLLADDLHWADTASLRWLVFIAERVEELPVAHLCARVPMSPAPTRRCSTRLPRAAAQVMRPAPLSPPGSATLVRARIPGAVDEFTSRLPRGDWR